MGRWPHRAASYRHAMATGTASPSRLIQPSPRCTTRSRPTAHVSGRHANHSLTSPASRTSTSPPGEQFTHLAAIQAYQASRNALLPGRTKATLAHAPWTVFADPRVARVGLTEREARPARLPDRREAPGDPVHFPALGR